MGTWPDERSTSGNRRAQAAAERERFHVPAEVRARRVEMRGREHVPAMPERVAALLGPALAGSGAVLVDATLGLAGHAEVLLAQHPRLRLVGLDRDVDALTRSQERLAPYVERITLVHATYDEIPQTLAELGHGHVEGALFDLGVSSLQVDSAERGFAYSYEIGRAHV